VCQQLTASCVPVCVGGLYYIALRFVFRDWKHMVNAAKQTIEKLEVLAAARDDERQRWFGGRLR
jgi:hypothetical protein